MKCFVVLLAFVLAIVAADKETQCYDAKADHYWDLNTRYNPIGECVTYTCTGVGEHASVSALTCTLFEPRPGCGKSDHDLTKPYPRCCPEEVC